MLYLDQFFLIRPDLQVSEADSVTVSYVRWVLQVSLTPFLADADGRWYWYSQGSALLAPTRSRYALPHALLCGVALVLRPATKVLGPRYSVANA